MERSCIIEKPVRMILGMILVVAVALSGCSRKRIEPVQGAGPAAVSPDCGFLVKKGDSFYRKGYLDQALSYYNKALEANPGLDLAYLGRGNVYAAKIFYDEAVSDYTKALMINPNSVEALKNRAMVYYYKDQGEQAIADYTKAILIDPKNTDLYLKRGDVYFHKKMYDQAIADYDNVIIAKPTDSEAYFRKAVTCELMGRTGEALESYTKFLHVAQPRSATMVKRANERIRQLGNCARLGGRFASSNSSRN